MGNIILFQTESIISFDNNHIGFVNPFKKRKKRAYLKELIKEVNAILEEPNFDKQYIMAHILNKLRLITGAEYGFIGTVVYDENEKPTLYTRAVSNIAWNASSLQFYKDHLTEPMVFNGMDTLFGTALTTGKSVIVNEYDTSRLVIPAGHPMIKRFIGVPFSFGEDKKPVCVAGLCNKLGKFDKLDSDNIRELLNIVAYLFVNAGE